LVIKIIAVLAPEERFRLVDVWVGVRDPRQAKKVEHDLVEVLGPGSKGTDAG
jgi:hypothetical protein